MREVREFSVVEVLEAGVRQYVQGSRLYLPLVLVYAVSVFAINELSGINEMSRQGTASAAEAVGWKTSLLSAFADLVLFSAVQAGLAYGVVRSLRGGEVTAVELWVLSLRLLPLVALISIVVVVLVGLGMLLLIIPGVLLLLMFSVAVPAGVVERCGVLAALKRSAQLTDGYKGPLFGLQLIYVVVTVSLLLWVGGLLAQSVVGALVLELLFSLVAGAAGAVAAAAYHDLRILKEGTGRADPT